MEPFVPKAAPQNGQQQYYMVTNGGFSLDAPEFVPNVYGSNGEVYAAWVTPNQVHTSLIIGVIHKDEYIRGSGSNSPRGSPCSLISLTSSLQFDPEKSVDVYSSHLLNINYVSLLSMMAPCH